MATRTYFAADCCLLFCYCFLVAFISTKTINAFPTTTNLISKRSCFIPFQTPVVLPITPNANFLSSTVTTSTVLVLSTMPYQSYPDFKSSTKISELYSTKVRQWKGVTEVAKWRIASVSFLTAVTMNRSLIDQQLIRLWNYLMSSQTSIISRIFRTDSYEWCLAIAAFTGIIHGYQFIDKQIDVANQKGVIHPLRKYRLQDRFLADKHRRKQQRQQKSADASDNEMVSSPSMSDVEVNKDSLIVHQSKWHVGAYFFELWVYALPLLTWDILSPRRHRRLAAFVAPTTVQIVTDVAGSLLLYDFLFFIGHFMMHKIPILYRKIHAKHHKTDEVRACDIVRLSLVEEVYDVACSIVALNLLSAHPISRSIYNVIIVFLLTELHSGYDFPWTPQNVVPFNIASGSRRHHYHHRFGHHYYQKFFFTFDRLFGLFQKDDGTLKGDSVKPDAFVPTSWKNA